MSTVETQARAAPSRSIQTGYDKRLMVTAGRTSMELGGKIAEKLNVDLTDAGLKTFANGEVYCKYEDSIRGADLFIIQSTCTNEAEGLTANDALMVGAPYALLEKERPAQSVAEIGYVIGADKVKGRKAVIVDDMIDTGGTLAAGAQTVLDAGASEVYAVATHGLFSGNAFETLSNSPLSGILVTDTVPTRPGAPDLIRVLSCADILSDSVRRIFTDDSVSEIFAGENQLF